MANFVNTIPFLAPTSDKQHATSTEQVIIPDVAQPSTNDGPEYFIWYLVGAILIACLIGLVVGIFNALDD